MTIFNPTQIADMARTLPPASDGHEVAVVGGVDEKGGQVVVGYTKATEHGRWEFAGAYRHEWAGDNKIGAQLLYAK